MNALLRGIISLLNPTPYRERPRFVWSCECGARSSHGWQDDMDAYWAGQKHWLNQRQSHPQPHVYSWKGVPL